MPEKGLWPLTVPLAGLVVLGMFVVGIAVVLGAAPSTPVPTGNAAGRVHAMRVVNGCSLAAQLGWVALDPVVPLDPDAAGRFFEEAVYIGESEWPYLDEYSTYPNQTPVLAPGETADLEVDSASLRRHRLLLVRTFQPKSGRTPGTTAESRIDIFDLGDLVPQEASLVDGEDSCVPQAPLDRRYRL